MNRKYGQPVLSAVQGLALVGSGITPMDEGITGLVPTAATDARKADGKPGRGPLHDTMFEACPECALSVEEMWTVTRALICTALGSAELCDTIEPGLARMLRFELKRSGAKHGHANLLPPVLETLYGKDGEFDAHGIVLLEMLEENHVRFADYRAFRTTRLGIAQRVPVAREQGSAFDHAYDAIGERLEYAVRQLDDAQRQDLTKDGAILRALDLFADGDGAVPLVTCLRIVVFLGRNNVSWSDAFYLWKQFTPAKAGELLAFASDPRTRARDIEERLARA